MKVKQYYKTMSYRWKIMVSYFMLILVPLLLVSVYIYQNSVHAIQQQSQTLFRDDISRKRSQLEQRLNEYENTGRQIAANTMLTNFFNSNPDSDIERFTDYALRISQVMDWIKNLEPANASVRFFTGNTRIFETEMVHYVADVRQQPWFAQAQTAGYAQPVWEPLHDVRSFQYTPSSQRGKTGQEISMFIPMVGTGSVGEEGTLVEIHVHIQDMFNIFGNGEGESGFLVISDADEIVQTNLEMDAAMRDYFAGGSWRDDATGIIQIGSGSYYLAHADINRLHSTIVTVYPAQEALSKMNRAGFLSIGATLAGLALMALLSLALSKTLVRKIDGLLDVMRSVQQGNMDVEAKVEGGDEIDELAADFNRMIRHIRELIDTVYKFSILQKDALFQSLQNQINPHFLYNTIETIRMMAETKKEREISDAMEAFGGMMRYNMSSQHEFVPIRAEMEQISAYCSLNNLMLNDKLELIVHMDKHVENACIPKLLIQPLVENSITHGFDQLQSRLRIWVDAKVNDAIIDICVRDNGVGIAQDYLQGLTYWLEHDDAPPPKVQGNGIGLKNVHQRIRLKYGKDFGMTIISVLGEGTTVHLKLPYIKRGMEDIR
ncbi:MAG: histidine kinase [Eubacteriales bacterium]|nr:histidine kinase [Eubacteriales bacterium]